MKCAQCESDLTGSWSTSKSGEYPYYRCTNTDCDYYGKSIKKAEIEEGFVDYLNKVSAKQKYIRLFKEIIKDIWQNRQASSTNEKKAGSARIDELEQRKDRLIDMRADGEIDKEKFKKEKAEVKQEIKEIEESRQKAIVDKQTLDDALEHAERLIKNAGDIWGQAPPQLKRKIQQIVPKEAITYDKESKNLEHRF